MPDQEPCWGSDSFSVWPVRSKIRFKRLWRPCHFLENPGFLCYFWFLWHLIKQYFCLLLYLTSSIQAGLSNISLQRSRPLHSFDYCFCHVFLQSVSVALIPAILNPQLISICVSHKEKKKKEEKSQPEIPFAFYCLKRLKRTISSPHVMCVFPFSSASIFPWKLAPASYRIVTPCVWAAHAWEEEGAAGKVSVTDRQTASGSSAHVFLKLQLWVDMFTFQTTHRLQWVQTGIFNYSCGLFPINKILRKKTAF